MLGGLAIRNMDDFPVGKSVSFEHRISSDQVDIYRRLSGDENPLHWNADIARLLGFREPVVHGMLVAGLFSRLVGMFLPGPGALYLKQTLEFTKPVFAGDELSVVGTVKRVSLSNRLLLIEIVALRSGDIVLQGDATVQLLEEVKKKMIRTHNEDSVVLITGDSGGIGGRIAQLCAQDGMRVALTFHRNSRAAQELCQAIDPSGVKATAFGCDLRDHDSVKKVGQDIVDRFERVDVIVNNAGVFPPHKTVLEEKFETYLEQYMLSVGAAFHLAQMLIPGMKQRGYGRIINIASEVACGAPPAGVGAYAAAKSALLSWTRVLAMEVGPSGITVNAVAPGLTDTTVHSGLTERQRQVIAAKIPTRTICQPDDVAGIVRFLAGAQAAQITGQVIHVNGGTYMN